MSDSVSVTIPDNTQFWIRSFFQNTAAIIYTNQRSTADSYNVAVSGLSDLTMGGTITHNSSTFVYHPILIVAPTTKPSAVIIGDSIGAGFQDNESTNPSPFDGRRGTIARSFNNVPFLNLSVSGEEAQNWIANHPTMQTLLPYFSHMISQIGRNDISLSGRTSAQVISSLQSIYDLLLPRQKVWAATLVPGTGSTDAWATTVNQTNGQNANHEALNTAIRNGTVDSRVAGFWETRHAVESSPGSNLWLPNNTGDGIHPNTTGYATIETSGVVDETDLAYP
jgi:hypothetical protein